MSAPSEPVYPITFRWPDGDLDVCEVERELFLCVEEYDSDDPSCDAIVTDALGRTVWLVFSILKPDPLVIELAAGRT